MKFTDLTDKSLEELETLAKDKKRELFLLRIKKQMSQLQNVSEIKKARKEIARILTAISQKKTAVAN
jgi:large subunit ribosomal protein L29